MSEELTPVQKLLLAFELNEAGDQLMRQNLRRRHPEATEDEIERLMIAWRSERPGAEHGDASGPGFRVGTWPRR